MKSDVRPGTSPTTRRRWRICTPMYVAKAIEIANALLEEGNDEGFAIRVAIARAKELARRHGAGID